MYENGANVDECKDQITEIGVQGKPHSMFPLSIKARKNNYD